MSNAIQQIYALCKEPPNESWKALHNLNAIKQICESVEEYEYSPEIKNILERCEANVTHFSNNDVSVLMCEIKRLRDLCI